MEGDINENGIKYDDIDININNCITGPIINHNNERNHQMNSGKLSKRKKAERRMGSAISIITRTKKKVLTPPSSPSLTTSIIKERNWLEK
jgi:hypothetical protein